MGRLTSAAMTTPAFDLPGLFRAVEAERERLGASLAAVARQVGVAASTIRRFADATDAEADGVLTVLGWLDAVPEDFVPGGSVPGTRLPREGGTYVRVDVALVAEAMGRPGWAAGRSRTTIQHLVDVAQASGRPVASLTRRSEG